MTWWKWEKTFSAKTYTFLYACLCTWWKYLIVYVCNPMYEYKKKNKISYIFNAQFSAIVIFVCIFLCSPMYVYAQRRPIPRKTLLSICPPHQHPFPFSLFFFLFLFFFASSISPSRDRAYTLSVAGNNVTRRLKNCPNYMSEFDGTHLHSIPDICETLSFLYLFHFPLFFIYRSLFWPDVSLTIQPHNGNIKNNKSKNNN